MGNFKKTGHCESHGGGTKPFGLEQFCLALTAERQSQGTTSSTRFIRSFHDEIPDVNLLKTHAMKCDKEEEHP
jgi:hypothetical protein